MKTKSKREPKYEIFIPTKTITSIFAKNAVHLSPYTVPDNLSIAIIKFHARLKEVFSEYLKFDEAWLGGKISRREWCLRIRSIIVDHKFTEVYQWNSRKNGNDSQYGIVCGVSMHKDPDDDFIDLDALAMNVERETWQAIAPEEFLANHDDLVKVIQPVSGLKGK